MQEALQVQEAHWPLLGIEGTGGTAGTLGTAGTGGTAGTLDTARNRGHAGHCWEQRAWWALESTAGVGGTLD